MKAPRLDPYPPGVPQHTGSATGVAQGAMFSHGNTVADVLQLVPDERCREAVKVVVARKDPALTEGERLANSKQHLTGYRLPRIVEFRKELLPKTRVGKMLRRDCATPQPRQGLQLRRRESPCSVAPHDR